ncbi:hypothetical protein NX774_12160 [Massilia agilis]|uniref:Uncharacterized protein n=1 Tax=Massilia agilis TaxID=1811226 RepID=A0ABT2DBI0_9BURK|nr:hypothetical protein [Massilia agilis]MCS0808674.1 hypothetical protein [Massilia agilis]
MNKAEMKVGEALSWYARKWWMRTRTVQAEATSEGIGASAELYCPWLAKPLDWLHAAVFGSAKQQPV